MPPRFRSSFAAPTGFVAAVTRVLPQAATAQRLPMLRSPVVSASAAKPQERQQAA